MLRSNSTLSELDLSCNALNPAGGTELLAVLQHNRCTAVSRTAFGLPTKWCMCIEYCCLIMRRVMVRLDLLYSQVSKEAAEAISSELRKRRCFKESQTQTQHALLDMCH